MVLERVRPRVSSRRAASGRVDFTGTLETGGGSGVIFLAMVNLQQVKEIATPAARQGWRTVRRFADRSVGPPAGISLLRTARHNADMKKPLTRRCAPTETAGLRNPYR